MQLLTNSHLMLVSYLKNTQVLLCKETTQEGFEANRRILFGSFPSEMESPLKACQRKLHSILMHIFKAKLDISSCALMESLL